MICRICKKLLFLPGAKGKREKKKKRHHASRRRKKGGESLWDHQQGEERLCLYLGGGGGRFVPILQRKGKRRKIAFELLLVRGGKGIVSLGC